MPTTLDRLLIRIEADSSALRTELEKSNLIVAQSKVRMERETQGIGAAFERAGQRILAYAATYLSIRAAIGVLRDVIRETQEAEQANARIAAVLRATGEAAGVSAEQIDRLATSLQRSTLFDDEEVKNAAAALLIFGNVGADQFDRVLRAGADLAALLGGDLQSNVLSIGKAMQDPERGLQMLNRQLRLFTDEERKAIAAMVEAGDRAGAMEAILARLESRVGGTAQALDVGLTGATNRLRDAWTNLLEKLGETDLIGGRIERAFERIARAMEALTPGTAQNIGLDLKAELDAIAELRTRIEEAKARLAEMSAPGIPAFARAQPEALIERLEAELRAREARAALLKRDLQLVLDPDLQARVLGDGGGPGIPTGADDGTDATKRPKKFPDPTIPEASLRASARHKQIEEMAKAYETVRDRARAAFAEIDGDLARMTQSQTQLIERAAAEQTAKLREIWEAGGMSAMEYAQAVDKINRTTTAQLIEAERERTEAARKESEERQRIQREEAEALRQMLAGTIAEIRSQFMAGSFDLGRIAQAVLADLASNLFERASSSLFDTLAGGLFDGLLGGLFGGGSLNTGSVGGAASVGGAPDFSFAFAEGGRPPVGRPALVGERGPELFVPDVPGIVVPNRELFAPRAGPGGGGPAVNVYQTFNVNEGATEGAVRMLRAVAGEIKRDTIATVIDANRRGAGAMLGG